MLTFFNKASLPIFLAIPPQTCWMEVGLCETFLIDEVFQKYVPTHYDNDSKILFGYTKIMLLSIAIYERHKMMLILFILQHLLYAMEPQ